MSVALTPLDACRRLATSVGPLNTFMCAWSVNHRNVKVLTAGLWPCAGIQASAHDLLQLELRRTSTEVKSPAEPGKILPLLPQVTNMSFLRRKLE